MKRGGAQLKKPAGVNGEGAIEPQQPPPTSIVIEAFMVGDERVWPKWASDALLKVLEPITAIPQWPGTQRIFHALAEAQPFPPAGR